tara:strand:- start:2969 stop:3448 length:480 start_codon:yes stop_codon:yes gene_type:complete
MLTANNNNCSEKHLPSPLPQSPTISDSDDNTTLRKLYTFNAIQRDLDDILISGKGTVSLKRLDASQSVVLQSKDNNQQETDTVFCIVSITSQEGITKEARILSASEIALLSFPFHTVPIRKIKKILTGAYQTDRTWNSELQYDISSSDSDGEKVPSVID